MHNGDAAAEDRLGIGDHGEVDSGWDENVDFDATTIGIPTGKATVEYTICCIVSFGWLEKITTIRSFDYVFYLLRLPFRFREPQNFIRVFRDNNIDVLCIEHQLFSVYKE